MSGSQRARLTDGRWHFQHGPIDCIVGADGNSAAIARSVERAWSRFGGILAELVDELALLRTDLASAEGAAVQPRGPIARRMVAACRAHAKNGRFITAMAAVAGSVADELIGAFDGPRIARAYINNGGDIALHLGPGAAFDIGWVVDPNDRTATLDGSFRITSESGVRGVATSGWRGRSFSLGIADAVTVLAASASRADAAATVIANAVDVDDPRIVRRPASELRDDSDLGDRLVTCAVPPLPATLVAQALERGRRAAARQIAAGRVVAALLCLQGRAEACGSTTISHEETCR
jgi:uncharacterized protein